MSAKPCSCCVDDAVSQMHPIHAPAEGLQRQRQAEFAVCAAGFGVTTPTKKSAGAGIAQWHPYRVGLLYLDTQFAFRNYMIAGETRTRERSRRPEAARQGPISRFRCHLIRLMLLLLTINSQRTDVRQDCRIADYFGYDCIAGVSVVKFLE